MKVRKHQFPLSRKCLIIHHKLNVQAAYKLHIINNVEKAKSLRY